MTELQAALGLSQSKRLHEFVKQRNQLAKIYDEAFVQSSLTRLKPKLECYSSYHLYIILLPNSDKEKHKQTILQLRAKKIFAHVHYIPIHLQPFYKELGFNKGDFPIAEEYYSRAISLPLFPELTFDDQRYIIDTVLELTESK
jgi:dTDP-4-amino-4,6-dideoxygalactose transaminase